MTRRRAVISGRLPRLDRANAWSSKVEERRARGARLLDLTNANPVAVGLATMSAADRAALAGLAADHAPDPRGAPAAREAVSAYYAERGRCVPPEHVVLTSGTSEAYAHLFRLLCDAGDAVLVPQPSYPLFEPIAALEAVRVETYRLERHARWSLDVASLESAGEGARAIVLVQPNHPTGSCLGGDERVALEEVALARDLAIVADEVFADYPWSAGDSLPSLLDRPRALTFALSGISKVCGLPQLKLSWIAVAGPERERDEALRGLEWIADLFLSVSTPAQLALPALLAGRAAFQARTRARIGTNLTALRALVARRPELEALDAEGGWVAVLRMPSRRGDEEWALELLEADVVVHPGHFYDFTEPWYLVVSLIVPPHEFAEGLARLEEALADPR